MQGSLVVGWRLAVYGGLGCGFLSSLAYRDWHFLTGADNAHG